MTHHFHIHINEYLHILVLYIDIFSYELYIFDLKKNTCDNKNELVSDEV